MNSVRVSVAITGTDDNGQSRPWSQSGTFQCISANDVTVTVTSTPAKIVNPDSGDTIPSFIYLENFGDVDIAYGALDPNGSTISHAIPAGAATFLKVHGPSSNAFPYIESIQLWTDSGTSEVRYILFY